MRLWLFSALPRSLSLHLSADHQTPLCRRTIHFSSWESEYTDQIVAFCFVFGVHASVCAVWDSWESGSLAFVYNVRPYDDEKAAVVFTSFLPCICPIPGFASAVCVYHSAELSTPLNRRVRRPGVPSNTSMSFEIGDSRLLATITCHVTSDKIK